MWNSIIEALIPFLVGFDIYWVSSTNEFHKIDTETYKNLDFAFADHLAIAMSDKSLAAYESETPIKELEKKLKPIQSTDIFPQINRSGPFYGWYLRVQKI